MKNIVAVLIISLIFSSCSNGQKDNSISEADFSNFLKAELDRFNRIKKDTSVKIVRIDVIEEYLKLNSINTESEKFDFSNLNWSNIEDNLLKPFKKEIISIEDFLYVIDTMDVKLAEFIALHFQKYKYDQLRTDDKLFNRILELSEDYHQTEDFLIRAIQRPEQFKQEIKDSVQSSSFYKRRHPEVDKLLSRYSEFGLEKETLNLLEVAIDKLPQNTHVRWTPPGDGINVFDYLLSSKDDEIKSTTRKLILRYLNKAVTTSSGQFNYLLSKESSTEFKDLLKTKLEDLDRITIEEERTKEERSFYQYYLSHYARNFRTSAIPLIEKATMLDESKLDFSENGINFKFKDNQDLVIATNGIKSLIAMSKLEDLSISEKEAIYQSFIKSNILQAKGSFWKDAIKLIRNLYPNSKYEDYEDVFSDVAKEYRYMSFEQYWNRMTYSVSELDDYFIFFDSINVDISQIDNSKLHKFISRYSDDDRVIIMWRVLELLDIGINYDCETGRWPNPYDELINQYLSKSKELEGFYPICKYNKKTEYRTEYTTILTNGGYGYLASPQDIGDWFDPITIERMLNVALEEVGSAKRYIQLHTNDQTILSIYAEPGQVKKIAERFDMQLVIEY